MQQRSGRDEAGVAALRRRVARAEEANQELLAFARGHAGAVATIHEAVLAVMAAETRAELLAVITGHWPAILGVDAAALAWTCGADAFVADRRDTRPLDARMVLRLAGMNRAVTARTVARGHPLFGPAAATVGAEVLVRLEGARGMGLLALGQSAAAGAGPDAGLGAGARLLRFLGRAAATMLERCPPT